MKKAYTKVSDLKHLPNLAKEVLADVGHSGIILLRGNLASGKTSFVKAFAEALGLKEDISSPTFSILHEYGEGLFHYDIYQCGSDGFLKNGLIEKLDEEGYHLIEWGDEEFEAILKRFGINFSTIDIETENLKRIYKVQINAYA